MPGTKEGGYTARDTNIERYGKDYFSRIGTLGGKAGNTGGFTDKALAKRAGAIGGTISRRTHTDTTNPKTLKARTYTTPKNALCTYCAGRGHSAYKCEYRVNAIRSKTIREARLKVIREEAMDNRSKLSALAAKWRNK